MRRRPGLFGARKLAILALLSILSVLVLAFAVSGSSGAPPTPTCTTANHLTGSNFEIDVDANLKVDGAPNCIDWLNDGANSAFRSDVAKKNDTASGPGDESFGQGTKEDDPNPTIVSGSIPPNKSDLKVFGILTETTTSGKFLELFWSRVNSPQGTTNMDFELNQKFCDPTANPTNCSTNLVTPLRTLHDKLITYDLSKGGTVPTISIRDWNGSAWGPAAVISGAGGTALGSVNTSAIPANEAGGEQPGGIGAQDPFQFGEAAIAFSALFPPGGGCGAFGSAYLKSRSADSFQSELKDFIPPERVAITNCTSIVTTLSASNITVGESVHDSATLSNATGDAGGTVAYRYYSTLAACQADLLGTGGTGAGTKTVTNGVVPDSDSVQFTSVGTFYWAAFYSGDFNNAPSKSDCATEVLVVDQAVPTISTTPNPSSGTVGDTLNDSATLANGFSPTGTIVFKLFGPNNPTCDPSGAAAVFTETVVVSGNGTYSTTTGHPTTQAGTYHWTASYGGDANNKPAASACADEAVVVNKKQPSISTTPNPSSGTIGVVLNDSATLADAFSPTGSIVFKLFGPNNSTCDPNGAAAVFTETVTVSGNGTYSTTIGYTTTEVGTYHWTASYGGDDNNLTAASACADEAVVVGPAESSIATNQFLYPNDKATVSELVTGDVAGDVKFRLFDSLTNCQNDDGTDTAAGLLYKEMVALPAAPSNSKTVETSNTSVRVSADATVYWRVIYSGDSQHNGRISNCVENTAVDFTDDPGPGTSP